MNLAALARALGGNVSGRGVLAPGPGHSARDRSLSVLPSIASPDGFIIHSHAGDDWRACKNHVRERLGLPDARRPRPEPARPAPTDGNANARRARAVALWHEAIEPRGTLAERYLASRGLRLPAAIAGEVIRFHPCCPWGTIHAPAMLAPLRSIHDDKITGVQRTRLTPDGRKVERRMLGIARAAAVKLDPDDAVALGLVIGEGVETCLAARQLGFAPAWALGSAGAIAAFPLLAGVEGLTLLAEDDRTGANARAVEACANRWHRAGREVVIVAPIGGGDANDALRRGAA